MAYYKAERMSVGFIMSSLRQAYQTCDMGGGTALYGIQVAEKFKFLSNILSSFKKGDLVAQYINIAPYIYLVVNTFKKKIGRRG